MKMCKLQKKRLEKSLSQRQLAELCGLTKETIYRYEAGRRTPSVENLVKIATILEVKIDDLI